MQWILVPVCLLFGGMMIAIAPDAHRWFYYAFGMFCFLIAAAAVLRGRGQAFVGSLIGVIVFALGVWYVASELSAGKVVGASPGDSSLLGAVAFMLVFGLPGLSYAFFHRFGFRREEAVPVPHDEGNADDRDDNE